MWKTQEGHGVVLKDRPYSLGFKTADFKSPFRWLEKEKARRGVHAFNLSAWKAEAGRTLRSSLVHRVSSRDAQKNRLEKQTKRKKERKGKTPLKQLSKNLCHQKP